MSLKSSDRWVLLGLALTALVAAALWRPRGSAAPPHGLRPTVTRVDSCAASPALPPGVALPIFRVAAADSKAGVDQLGALGRLVGLSGIPQVRDGRMVLENDTLALEVYLASNAVWFEDRARLWNPDAHPVLPPPPAIKSAASGVLAQPAFALDAPFRWAESVGRTVMARFARDSGRVQMVDLDVQIDFEARVRVDAVGELRVAGGGGKAEVVLGDSGRVIGFSSFWRAVGGVDRTMALESRAAADRRFLDGAERLAILSCTAELAYYAAPPSMRQDYLYPVWLYSAVALAGVDTVHLRETVVPATTFAPPEPSPPAPTNVTPPFENRDPDPEDGGGVARLEGGTAWIDDNLRRALENTRGFVEGLKAAGGSVGFDHEPRNALQEDWIDEDDKVVDRVDLVFYTGHAEKDGWALKDKNVSKGLVGSLQVNVPDYWGDGDEEWIVIGACGPLQDLAIGTSRSEVFVRWGGAFDGLHILLGYGSDSRDTPEEGRALLRYAMEGRTMLNAWLRAAQETQPTTIKQRPVWAGALFPYKGVAHSGNDHLWGWGAVSEDILVPDGFIAVWTTT